MQQPAELYSTIHVHHMCSVISPTWCQFMTGRILDTSGPLEVSFFDSGSPRPVPPHSKEQMALLLLGCCPPTATSTSVSWCPSTFSTVCWQTQQTLWPQHGRRSCTAWITSVGLQTPPQATSSGGGSWKIVQLESARRNEERKEAFNVEISEVWLTILKVVL